jgi:uncharacterized protein (TIGR00266 family)
MDFDIQFRPANTAVKIKLKDGESITTEGGSMIAKSGNVSVETTTYKKGKGSFWKSFKRIFAGESFFLNHWQSSGEGELWISSKLSGDIVSHQLNGEKIIVQGSSFLASEKGIEMDTGWQGLKSLFAGEGLFWLKMEGSGTVLLNAFGEIYQRDIDGEYIIDSGHIVAFEETLDFTVSKVGGSWIKSFFSGEGFVTRFKGKGRVWIQSHNPGNLGVMLTPLLKPKRR